MIPTRTVIEPVRVASVYAQPSRWPRRLRVVWEVVYVTLTVASIFGLGFGVGYAKGYRDLSWNQEQELKAQTQALHDCQAGVTLENVRTHSFECWYGSSREKN